MSAIPSPARTDGGTITAYVGFSVAAAGAIAGAITGTYVMLKASEFRDVCPTNHCAASEATSLATASTLAGVSTVAFAVAGAGLAVGVAAVVVRPKQEASRAYVAFGLGGIHGAFE